MGLQRIIKGLVISNKAYIAGKEQNRVVFLVDMNANKPLIKQAIETNFNVKVDKINTLICKGKNRLVRKKTVKGADKKKAIVTLAEGYSLNLLNQMGTATVGKSE